MVSNMHAIAGVDTKHRMNARIFMNAPLLPMVAVYQKSSVGITKISVDPRERASKVPFTDEQLTAMRGGLTVEQWRRKIIRKWGKR